jgi:hypothetical protein
VGQDRWRILLCAQRFQSCRILQRPSFGFSPSPPVIPAKAGIQERTRPARKRTGDHIRRGWDERYCTAFPCHVVGCLQCLLDSGLRRNDGDKAWRSHGDLQAVRRCR